MNIVEMYALCKKIYVDNEDKYYYIGLRFEDKEREIGEECEYSHHNPDREDERDFPVFGSDEYDDLEILDGTSAWNLITLEIDRHWPGWGRPPRDIDFGKDCSREFLSDHCYVVAGKRQGNHDNPDDGEILIKDAVVIAKIF